MIKEAFIAAIMSTALMAPSAAQDDVRISGPEIVADLHRAAAQAGDRFSLDDLKRAAKTGLLRQPACA